MGSVYMAERKSRRCRIKVKTQRADRFPVNDRPTRFFRTGPQQKYTCMERHILSATIRNKFSTRQPSLEIIRNKTKSSQPRTLNYKPDTLNCTEEHPAEARDGDSRCLGI